MSISPEPSPLDGPDAAPPGGLADTPGRAAGAGLSLASCARLLSENSTEFSLRSPRSLAPWLAGAAAGLLPNRSPPSSSLRAELADAAANRSPGSLRAAPTSSPPPNIAETASAPPPRGAAAAWDAPPPAAPDDASRPANVS